MMLSRAGEYAVRCVLYMSGQSPGRTVPRKEVARAMGIPETFLSKIAQDLARAGIILIRQGSRGGYRLLREPADITLLDVVEAVDGEIYLNECIMQPESCRRSPMCRVHRVWQKARERVRQTLGEADFRDLGRGEFCSDKKP
ncbi:MAG: RrF2 family transcriptional regulator [Desulfonatronovibrionaceae bacterium]